VRTILFTGKGGVGKTTLSAATALLAAARGHRTLVISTDVAHSLADSLSAPLGNDPRPVGSSGLKAAELDTAAELDRYWGEIQRRIAALLRAEGLDASVASELAVIPGLDEVLTLVSIQRYYDAGDYDLLVIDSAPTGAAMRLLAAPDLSRWLTRSMLGMSRGIARAVLPSLRRLIKIPIGEAVIQDKLDELFAQVDVLRGILTDGEQTSVRLVLNPDTMSIRETQRAYTYMNLFGLSVDALFVNRVLPPEVQDPFFDRWKAEQAERRQEVRQIFAPLPVFEVALRGGEVMGPEALRSLGAELYNGQDPAERLSREEPLRFAVENGQHVMILRVAGVTGSSAHLEKHGDELSIRLGTLRRTVPLPQYLAALRPAWAQVRGEHLVVAFEAPPAEPAQPVAAAAGEGKA